LTAKAIGRRPRLSLAVLAWTVSNLIIGYFVIFPLVEIRIFVEYVRAVWHHTVVPPYGSTGAKFSVVVILLLSAFLLGISILVNRRYWRRFNAAGSHPFPSRPMAWVLIIVGVAVVQIIPFLVYKTATDLTFPPLFPKGWS
jgi:hypothetical protein